MADEEYTGEVTISAPGLEELEEWEDKKRRAEKDKISFFVEGMLLLMVAAVADFFEILTGLSVVLWLVGLVFGLFASGIIFMWAILRGGEGYLVFRRIIINIAGWLFDAVLLGILPIRTIALLLTFWYNNRDAKKRIEEATTRIEEISKAA